MNREYRIYMNPETVKYEVVVIYNDTHNYDEKLLSEELFETEDDAKLALLFKKDTAPEEERKLYD